MTSTIRAGLIGAGIGGASVFLLDRDRGASRRALVRATAIRAAQKSRDAAGALPGNWSPMTKLLAGASVAAAGIVAATAAAQANGRARRNGWARTEPPSAEQESLEGIETEIGILVVGTAPSEPGTFASDEFTQP